MRIQRSECPKYKDVVIDLFLDPDEIAAIKDGYAIAENISINGKIFNIGILSEAEDENRKENQESDA